VGRIGLGAGPSGATTRRAQIICEDEYIGEINGSVGFATSAFACNPGQAGTFPWGNKIASLYEEYEFLSLEFYYKREVSEFSTNGQAGKVILSFDYDASDSAPTTKQQVEDTVPHVDAMPCTPVLRLPIDCSRIRKNSSKYVRSGAQPANTDLKLYDAGNLFVSTQGCTAATVIGELHVRYCVRLSEPVLDAASTVGGAAHFSGIAPTTADNFADAVLQAGASPQLQGITARLNVLTFPAGIPGNYIVYFSLGASTSVTSIPTVTLGGGATALSLMTTGGARDSSPQLLSGATAAASNSVFRVHTFSLSAAGGTLTLTPATLVGGDELDIWIFSLPATVLTRGAPATTSQYTELSSKVDRLMALLSGPSSPRKRKWAADEEDDESFASAAEPDDFKAAAATDRPIQLSKSLMLSLLGGK